MPPTHAARRPRAAAANQRKRPRSGAALDHRAPLQVAQQLARRQLDALGQQAVGDRGARRHPAGLLVVRANHQHGDAVLRQLSLELRRNLRENDLAGRYGGDEFCVILPQMSQEQAVKVMDRLRDIFSNYRAPQIPELRVSLSIGLAGFQPSFTDAAMWLNAADRALYTAKKTGRNRVNVSDEKVACSA